MEGEKLALTILKQVMEEKLNDVNVEIVTVTPKIGVDGHQTGVFHRLTKEEITPLLTDL